LTPSDNPFSAGIARASGEKAIVFFVAAGAVVGAGALVGAGAEVGGTGVAAGEHAASATSAIAANTNSLFILSLLWIELGFGKGKPSWHSRANRKILSVCQTRMSRNKKSKARSQRARQQWVEQRESKWSCQKRAGARNGAAVR
jgi:carbonic anhydrase/acetyltransferase-like protein (isoleucine patch superfamily)